MANLWTPNSPTILGLPWMVTFRGRVPISGSTAMPLQALRSLATERVTGFEFGLNQVSSEARPFTLVVDVLPVGNELGTEVLTENYPVNDDTAIEAWRGPGGDTTDLWAHIDDPVGLPPTDANYIELTSGTPQKYTAHCATGAFPLTRRVLNLSITGVFSVHNNGAVVARRFDAKLYNNVTDQVFALPNGVYYANIYGSPIFTASCGELNPVTLRPWTCQDVREFDAGQWELRIESAASVACPARIHSLALKVDYMSTDNREASAVWRRSTTSGLAMRSSYTLTQWPGGEPYWDKPVDLDYALLFRQADDLLLNGSEPRADDISLWTQGQSLGRFGGDAYPPVPGMAYDSVNLEHHQVPTVPPTYEFRRAATVNLIVTGGGVSNDSQPYAQTLRSFALTHSSSSPKQTITAPQTDDYLGIRTVVAPPVTSTATLNLRVHKVSDGLPVGPAYVVDAAVARSRLIDGIESRVAFIEGFFPEPLTLVAGTQYEVRYTTSAPSSDPWTAYAVGDGQINPDGDSATMGGATDKATLPGLSSAVNDGIDMCVVLLKQPDAPDFAVAEMIDVELGVTPGGRGSCKHCAVKSVEMLRVRWAETSNGGSFAYYEVQRAEYDDPDEWETVHLSLTEDRVEWTDPTTRRSIPTRYRVRAVLNDTSFSDWAVTDWATASAHGVEVVFAMLTAPERTLAFNWDPAITFDFLSAKRDTIVPMYGNDKQVAFMEVENRGVSFPLKLFVNAWSESPPPGGAIAYFRALEDLVRLPGPYVAVLDHLGNRYYAHVQIDTGDAVEPRSRYYANVLVTEVTATAFPLAVA